MQASCKGPSQSGLKTTTRIVSVPSASSRACTLTESHIYSWPFRNIRCPTLTSNDVPVATNRPACSALQFSRNSILLASQLLLAPSDQPFYTVALGERRSILDMSIAEMVGPRPVRIA
jgi:hypothetical protein